jgi:hypothetical protein
MVFSFNQQRRYRSEQDRPTGLRAHIDTKIKLSPARRENGSFMARLDTQAGLLLHAPALSNGRNVGQGAMSEADGVPSPSTLADRSDGRGTGCGPAVATFLEPRQTVERPPAGDDERSPLPGPLTQLLSAGTAAATAVRRAAALYGPASSNGGGLWAGTPRPPQAPPGNACRRLRHTPHPSPPSTPKNISQTARDGSDANGAKRRVMPSAVTCSFPGETGHLPAAAVGRGGGAQ